MLYGLAGVIDGFGWETEHELVLSVHRSCLHHIVVDVTHQVVQVKSDGGPLAIVEPDLDGRLGLRLVHDG